MTIGLRLRGCLLVLLALLAAQAFAQPRGPHRFNRIDFDNGLPGSYVTSLLQRPDGFVWIGTDSGVVRYDGHGFRHLQYEADNPASLSNSWIRDLVSDGKGRMWAASDHGLNRMLDDESGFVRYTLDPADDGSLPGNKVYGLHRDRAGDLWAGTDAGMARYDAVRDRFERHVPPAAGDPLRRTVRVMLEDSQERFWVGTHRGLLRFDRAAGTFAPVQTGDATLDEKLAAGYVARALEDRRGTVWFAIDGDGGLASLDRDGRWALRTHAPQDPHSLPSDSVWSLGEDLQGRLWIGTWGEGLAVLDAERRSMIRYRANEADEFGLPNDTVTDVMIDASGLVWLTTGSAAAIVNPNSDTLRQYTAIPGDSGGLPNRNVWSMRTDTDGSVWVGTEQGVARIEAGGERLIPYPARRGDAPDADDGTVWAIEPDGAGGVWLGTDAGLDHFDPARKVLRHLHGSPDSGQKLSQAVYAITRDADGSLWVSEEGVGLHRVDAQGRVLESLEPAQGLPNTHANRALQLAPGLFWFGSTQGLFAFDARARRFHAVERGPQADLLSRVVVNGLGWDPVRHSLWVATDDQGVFEVTRAGTPAEAEVGMRISSAEGLPDERTYSALADGAGRLWITTTKGLSSFELQSRQWGHYGAVNETRRMKFVENAAATAAGSLYFGGSQGLIRFEPHAIVPSAFTPALRLSGLLVRSPHGEQVIEGRAPDRIDVAHDFHSLELRAASLDFAAPQRNLYRYRLEGAGEDWVELGTDNRIVLRDLAHGAYRLTVQGTNRDGVWSPLEAGIGIRVLPPPWLTSQAYALYALLTVLLGLGLASAWRRRAEGIARIAASERRLSGALWGSGDELWDWNVQTGAVIYSNLLPSLPPPGPGSRGSVPSLMAAVHPDDADALRSALERIIDGRSEEFEAVYRLPGLHERWVWVLDRGKLSERGPDGRPLRIMGTLRNVDSIMRTEEQLALVASALQQSHDGALILDREYRLVFANAAAERYLRVPAAELRNTRMDPACYHFVAADEGAEQLARFALALREGQSAEGEFTLGVEGGGRVPVAVSVNPVRNRRGEVTHCVTFLSDITFRRQAEDELRRLARFDSLTGLPNRSLFLDRLEHALAQTRRTGAQLALLFIDLDHFKHVNDTLGHAAGDVLLCGVAERLRAGTRDADTVARLGGDEFTVIVESAVDEAAVVTVAHKLIESLAAEFDVAGQQVRVSPSIGIALFPGDGATADELLKHSDIAMYHAKSEGRNNFQFYRPEMNARVLERIALEERLRRALAADALDLHYQPKMCTDTGRVLGLEALLRWHDPEEGMIPPARFIPVAEESGLIVELGYWVLRRACLQTADWLARGFDPGTVAVNLSARQFRERDLIADIHGVLQQCALPADRLELEITESTLVGDMDYATAMLGRLRGLGVRLALDDFGTGYSSLSYLRRFPIHTLKLDRSFLREVPDNAQDARFVESIVRLAHDIGVRVTAEGIESQPQWDFLRQCRCEEVQGYLCARPLPAAQVEALLPRA